MKRILFAMMLVLAVSGLAMAQDTPKWEVFGGYSINRTDLASNNYSDYYYDEGPGEMYSFMSQIGAKTVHGFNFAVTRNLNPWLGIKTEFSGYFGTPKIDGNWMYSQERSEGEYDEYDYHYQTTWSGSMPVRNYNLLAGPEFSYRKNSRIRPFAHALFGFSKLTGKGLEVEYERRYWHEYQDYSWEYDGVITGDYRRTAKFAMALGGGLDVKAGKHVSIRVVQFDYLANFQSVDLPITDSGSYYNQDILQYDYVYRQTNRLPGERFNNLRLSFGVVVGF